MTDRIGILGGTFNPIHLGHLVIAEMAMESFELSEVLLVPCSIPSHKDHSKLISGHHRLAMIEAAIEGDLQLVACDIELQRGGMSYAIDTIKELRILYPDKELCFIIGSDTLTELYMWKDIEELLTMCTFVTMCRPSYDIASVTANDINLPESSAKCLLSNVAYGKQIDISSTDIRYRIAEGMSIKYFVPSVVEMYIAEHGLYKM